MMNTRVILMFVVVSPCHLRRFLLTSGLQLNSFEKGHAEIDYVKNPIFALHDFWEQHCLDFSQSVHQEGYDYS